MANDDWDDNQGPLAYLITFRTFGTWLHGDERESVDRHGKNIYGTPKVLPSKNLKVKMQRNQTSDEAVLNGRRRGVVESAVREVCRVRGYLLLALSVRTNHVHAVVMAAISKPESVMNAFKAYSTRKLRAAELLGADERVWSRGGSTRYLWKENHVEGAVHYVLHGQGEDLPNF